MNTTLTDKRIDEMAGGGASVPGAGARAPRRRTVIRAPSFSPSAIFGNLARLLRYFDLLVTLTEHRVKVRYKQSVLGILWAVLQPLSLMLIYTVIFAYIARMPTGETPFALFAYTALLPWTSFSTALLNASNGVVSNSGLVTKVYFPREILPLSYVLATLVDLFIASIVLLGLMLYYGVALTPYALYTIPIVIVMMVFVSAVSLFLSALQVRFRDVGVGLPLLLQLWMFATPVVYPLSALDKLPAIWRTLYNLNPMVGVIENFRRVVLQGVPPDFTTLGISAGISLVLLPITYMYFKHAEATMADTI